MQPNNFHKYHTLELLHIKRVQGTSEQGSESMVSFLVCFIIFRCLRLHDTPCNIHK